MSAEFSTILLRWFAQNGRELPWRATQDPYAIWLSEIILQQTRVQQGWAYWDRFMRLLQQGTKFAYRSAANCQHGSVPNNF